VARIVRDLAGEASRVLRQAAAARLGAIGQSPGAASLRRHVLAAAGEARRARDPVRLARLDEWLAFLSRGHTAGEARLIERLARGTRHGTVPAGVPPGIPGIPAGGGALRIRLTGIVVFHAGGC
jgi:hypothetical protein